MSWSDRNNDWGQYKNSLSRDIRTIDMNAQEKADLVADIGKFLTSKQWYKERAIPWRRGYLFHGPPGTGKTSIVSGLATHFKIPVYLISISRISSDATLATVLRNINGSTMSLRRSSCIVLLEDVDCAGLSRKAKLKFDADTEKEDKPLRFRPRIYGGITLSGLLNAIDGILAPEGHVLIMTSNHIEELDEALTRPGRIDYRLCFDLATKEQAKAIFLRLQGPCVGDAKGQPDLHELAETFADKIPEKLVSPADLQAFLRRCDDARKQLTRLTAG